MEMDYRAPEVTIDSPLVGTCRTPNYPLSPCVVIPAFPGKDTRTFLPCFKDVFEISLIC